MCWFSKYGFFESESQFNEVLIVELVWLQEDNKYHEMMVFAIHTSSFEFKR